MAITLAPDLATSVLEGAALRFTFLKEAGDPADFSIRWVITPAGYLPLTPGSSIASFTGTVDFTSSDSVYHFDLATTDASTGGSRRSFDIEFFVVDDTDSTGDSDTSIERVSRQIEDDDTPPENDHNLNNTGEADALVLGTLYDIPSAGGAGGRDTFYITQYLHGNVTISDISGPNTIVFDYGVEITNVFDVGVDDGQGGTFYTTVTFTLSTGAKVTMGLPSSENFYLFQIGGGEAKSYTDIREDFPAHIITNDRNAVSEDPFIVDSIADLPANLPETRPTDTINLVNGAVDDVTVLGGAFDIPSAGGAGGRDYLIISKYLTGNVTISDISGPNTIVFDYGVEITNVFDVGVDDGQGGTFYTTVTFTLSTGAKVTMGLPSSENFYLFQIGGGEAKSYTDIRDEFIDATVDDPFTVPLPDAGPPPPFTLPDTGTTYFRYDASAADAQDHGFYRFTQNTTPGLDDDPRDTAAALDDTDVTGGDDLIILDGAISRDFEAGDALTGGGGDDVYRLDLKTIGAGVTGPLTLHLKDLNGDNILHLIADDSATPNLITGVEYDALLKTLVLQITAPDGADAGDDRDAVAEVVLNAQNFDIYIGETLLGLDAGLALADLPDTVALEVV